MRAAVEQRPELFFRAVKYETQDHELDQKKKNREELKRERRESNREKERVGLHRERE